MTRIIFNVQGSEPEPYEVIFRKDNVNIVASCTCASGMLHKTCKHRVNIVRGNSENIVSRNATDVPIVHSWLPGSNIEAALKALEQAENEKARLLSRANTVVATAKKRLADAFRG